jgi:hypothetical protein
MADSSDDRESRRYKQALNDTLQQLDYCIGYLVGIHKNRIARQLAHNRAYIREELMKLDKQPLPTSRA